MPLDRYGLPVTTTSPQALEAYDNGVEAALGWKANALDLFREAARHDPPLAVAHAGAAACLFLEERFEPLRPRIVELGGSRAQRDVFQDTLIEACFRGGDMERAERLLAERFPRRPDHFWIDRRQAGGAPSPK